MGKSRSFSIYLLKKDYSADNALKDDHKLGKPVEASDLPDKAILYVLDSEPRRPWWRGYFGIRKELSQVLKGALVFMPVGERNFVLSFGHVFHNLNEYSYEYDFGLRVTLNSVDPTLLKSTDILEPGSARRRRTQLPVNSDLTYFDIDRDSTILKSLTGKVKEEYKDLFKHATGASNLRISSPLAPNELVGLCQKLLELYEDDTFKTVFPDIQNISPVKDPLVIEKLNNNLLQAFVEKNDTLNLTVPDLLNYIENVYAAFSGCGGSELFEDVFVEHYYSYLAKNGKNIKDINIEDFKKHYLKLVDEEGTVKGGSYSIYKCLIIDTTLGTAKETYHLSEGNWYKISTDYVTKLSEYLDPFCEDLPLPVYNHKREGDYNKDVELNDKTYLCLDTKSISPTGQYDVEPCDLYSVEKDFAQFYHVKVSTLSKELSHLFNQGLNSIELLKSEEQSRKKLDALIDASTNHSPKQKKAFKSPLLDQNYAVTFAIVTHKDKAQKSANLPLFSRISLRRNLKSLVEIMSIRARYGFVKDDSKKAGGKKKKKKKIK